MSAVQLVITMSEDGRMNLSGPLDNKILCYGLLEAAKDALRARAAQEAKLVQPVPAMPFVGRG